MTIEQDAHKTHATFMAKARERILEWTKIAGVAPGSLTVWLRRMAAGTRKSTWVVFAIMLAGNIIAFHYYQARITRYYLSVLVMNMVRLNEDLDTLQAKLNQLDKKTDDLNAKLNKPALSSSSVLSATPSSNLAKSRSR